MSSPGAAIEILEAEVREVVQRRELSLDEPGALEDVIDEVVVD